MPRALATALPFLLFLASVSAHSEDPVAAFGKQRAAASRLEWEIREAGHPVLGPIRFAHTRSSVVTPVGSGKVFSNAYVSCEKSARTIAIELTNQTAPDDPGGLRPAAMPRLVCISPAGANDTKVVQQVLEASWQVNPLGDAMARGLRPSALRACAAIGIVEDVVLPKGWPRSTAPIAFEISPYARDLDSIFVTCGEMTAYAPAAASPSLPPKRESTAPSSAPAWKTARTIASGKTNVRAGPNVHSAIVARLNPGAVVFVQSTGGEWWRAKSRSGTRFEGYIREDRLVIK